MGSVANLLCFVASFGFILAPVAVSHGPVSHMFVNPFRRLSFSLPLSFLEVIKSIYDSGSVEVGSL